jgi:hypothetical protein
MGKLRYTDDDGNVGPEVEVDAEKFRTLIRQYDRPARNTAASRVDDACIEVCDALAAAMPRKARIHPQPGDALRRRSDGYSFFWSGNIGGTLDPAEWQIIPAARIARLFDEPPVGG